MGFFTKDAAVPAGGLEPVSNERLERLFDETGVSYGVDPDGGLGGYWDDHLFVFWHLGEDGEFFQSRGRWMRGVPESEHARVLELVNEWNRDKLWPKAYVEVYEGQVIVFGEHTVDYEDGATDNQVHLHVRTGVSAALSFFDTLDAQFPEHVAADQARREAEAAAAEAGSDGA